MADEDIYRRNYHIIHVLRKDSDQRWLAEYKYNNHHIKTLRMGNHSLNEKRSLTKDVRLVVLYEYENYFK